jgi:hypothetical protein
MNIKGPEHWWFIVYTDKKTKEQYSVAFRNPYRGLKEKKVAEDAGMYLERCYKSLITFRWRDACVAYDEGAIKVYKCWKLNISEVLKLINETRRIDPQFGWDYCYEIKNLERILKKTYCRERILDGLLLDRNNLSIKDNHHIVDMIDESGDEMWELYKQAEGLL